MIILGRQVIDRFKRKHARSRPSLDIWLQKCEAADWKKFSDVRKTFNSVDIRGNEFIFDIAGNNFRLIARVRFEEGILTVVEILTHEEYSWRS